MKIVAVITLSLMVYFLIRSGKLNNDLSLPWFIALALLALASASDRFILLVADLLGIVYAPLAIVLIVLFILFGLIIFLTIVCSQLRHRQFSLMRELARLELEKQEQRGKHETSDHQGERRA